MPLATTTEPHAPAPLSRTKWEVDRAERHARAEARSRTRRASRGAPRRDDIARVALFIFLMQYRGSRHDSARAVVRRALMELLADAGYDASEANAVFDAMIPRVGQDLDSYLSGRSASSEVRNTWRRKNGLGSIPGHSSAEQK